MKKKIFIIICAFCVWVVGGCGDKSISSKTETQENISGLEDEAVNGEINLKSEDLKKSDGEIYWWHADLTNDGIDEEIFVNTFYLFNMSYASINTIEIYSGQSRELIWSEVISPVHMKQMGVNLYSDETGKYLLIWEPVMYQGQAVYRYRLVSLSETGEEIQKKSNEVKFDVFKQEEHDIENIMAFADEVNSYMKKSFILVDTNGGKQIYSTHENKIEPVFDPTELINEMKKMREDSISDIE